MDTDTPKRARKRDPRGVAIGDVFARWTVVGSMQDSGKKDGSVAFPVRCDCGSLRTVLFRYLGTRTSQSCGCHQKEVAARGKYVHGESYNIDYKRERYFVREYGMTLADLQNMMDEQEDCCAICDEPLTSATRCVDHDHSTGKVRGLLCRTCNLGIGYLKDDSRRLLAAVSYLRRD